MEASTAQGTDRPEVGLITAFSHELGPDRGSGSIGALRGDRV